MTSLGFRDDIQVTFIVNNLEPNLRCSILQHQPYDDTNILYLKAVSLENVLRYGRYIAVGEHFHEVNRHESKNVVTHSRNNYNETDCWLGISKLKDLHCKIRKPAPLPESLLMKSVSDTQPQRCCSVT